MTDDLFPEAVQLSPYLAFRDRHGIWTHHSPDVPEDSQWTAFSLAVANQWLKDQGYEPDGWTGLKDEMTAIASYCRIFDENGLMQYGRTEREAVCNLGYELRLSGWEDLTA